MSLASLAGFYYCYNIGQMHGRVTLLPSRYFLIMRSFFTFKIWNFKLVMINSKSVQVIIIDHTHFLFKRKFPKLQ